MDATVTQALVERQERGQSVLVPLEELFDEMRSEKFRCVIYLPGGRALFYSNTGLVKRGEQVQSV